MNNSLYLTQYINNTVKQTYDLNFLNPNFSLYMQQLTRIIKCKYSLSTLSKIMH